MNSDLAGKTVLITGASGGIGSALARAFAAEGAKLVLHYRSNRAGITALTSDLHRTESLVVRADLARETDTKKMFAAAVKKFGRVDVLIANAGSWETRDIPLHQMPLKQWKHTFDAVLTSTFLCLREFLRLVAKQKHGNAVL